MDKAIAYHQAGHGVAASLVRVRFPRVTLVPCDLTLWGTGHLEAATDQRTCTRAKAAIFIALAGAAAEAKVTGKREYGDHYRAAYDIAITLVGSFETAAAYVAFMAKHTTDVLTLHWGAVQALATVLLERQTLPHHAVRRCIQEALSSGNLPRVELL